MDKKDIMKSIVSYLTILGILFVIGYSVYYTATEVHQSLLLDCIFGVIAMVTISLTLIATMYGLFCFVMLSVCHLLDVDLD